MTQSKDEEDSKVPHSLRKRNFSSMYSEDQEHNGAAKPVLLEFKDFKYPDNQTSNKRPKLPKLLPYKLPRDLLIRLDIPQLTPEDLGLKIAVSASKKLKQSVEPIDKSGSSTPKTPKTPNTPNTPNTPGTPHLPHTPNKYEVGSVKLMTEQAERLKKTAIGMYQDRQYPNSILIFTESLLLLSLAIQVKEAEQQSVKPGNDIKGDLEYAKCLTRKRRDWNSILAFTDKVITNFSKADSKNIPLDEMVGLVYYVKGFIETHLSELLMRHIELIKEKLKKRSNVELTAQLIKLLDKYNDLKSRSSKSMMQGASKLGIFKIFKDYPRLYHDSMKDLSKVDHKDLYLCGLNIENRKRLIKFKIGVNYCLPINTNNWEMNNLLNFGTYFIREWCVLHQVKLRRIFE